LRTLTKLLAVVLTWALVFGSAAAGLYLANTALATVPLPGSSGIVTIMVRPAGAAVRMTVGLDQDGTLIIEVHAPRRVAQRVGGTVGDVAIALTGDIAIASPRIDGEVSVEDAVDCSGEAVLLGRCDEPAQLFIFRPEQSVGVPHLVDYGRVTGRPRTALVERAGGEVGFAAPYVRLLPLPGDVDREPSSLELPDLVEATGPTAFGRPDDQLSEVTVLVGLLEADGRHGRLSVKSASPGFDETYGSAIFVWGSCATDDICPERLDPRAAVSGGLARLEDERQAQQDQLRLLIGGVLLGAVVPEIWGSVKVLVAYRGVRPRRYRTPRRSQHSSRVIRAIALLVAVIMVMRRRAPDP
jgi:hypothetical protein